MFLSFFPAALDAASTSVGCTLFRWLAHASESAANDGSRDPRSLLGVRCVANPRVDGRCRAQANCHWLLRRPQPIDRAEAMDCGQGPGIYRGTTLYSFALDRVLGAAEMLWIYGRSQPEDIACSEGELRDLVGNGQTSQTL